MLHDRVSIEGAGPRRCAGYVGRRILDFIVARGLIGLVIDQGSRTALWHEKSAPGACRLMVSIQSPIRCSGKDRRAEEERTRRRGCIAAERLGGLPHQPEDRGSQEVHSDWMLAKSQDPRNY